MLARLKRTLAAFALMAEAVLPADALDALVQLRAVRARGVRARVRPLVARQQVRVLVFDEAQIKLFDMRRQAQRCRREVRRVVLSSRGGNGFD